MKKKIIKIHLIKDVQELTRQASLVVGDVIVRRGHFSVDCRSLMGLISIDLTQGATIEYPEEAFAFESFLSNFEEKS